MTQKSDSVVDTHAGSDVEKIDAEGLEVVKLRKSIMINGKEIREIVLDFDLLTGAVIREVEQEMMAHKVVALGGAALSQTFNMYVAARAARMNIHDLERMNIRDVTRITTLTQNFLMKSESDEETK